jgi:hypothetical protein
MDEHSGVTFVPLPIYLNSVGAREVMVIGHSLFRTAAEHRLRNCWTTPADRLERWQRM